MARNNSIIFDGKIIPADQKVVSANSRGIMYGDGVFETFRTYRGRTFCLQQHLDRLFSGMDLLGIPEIRLLEPTHLGSLLYNLLDKEDLLAQDGIIRLQVWRDGVRGYSTDHDVESHFSMTAFPCPKTFSFPTLATIDRCRIPAEALPATCKFSNGINYILASKEAAEKDADDALMQTMEGWVSETTIANIFWVKDATIFTPSDDCDLIPGIVRNILLELIEQEKDWNLEKGRFGPDDIWDADAVWICNSVRELLPVQQIDDHSFDVGCQLFKEIKARFEEFRDRNLKSVGT